MSGPFAGLLAAIYSSPRVPVSTTLPNSVARTRADECARPARRLLPWLAAGLLVAVALAASPNFRWEQGTRESPFAGDFLQEWLGGRLLLEGERERFYDTAHAQQVQHDPAVVGFTWDEQLYLPLVYPPFWYAIVSPLALLPFQAAAWVWAGLMIGCLVGAIVMLQAAGTASHGMRDYGRERSSNLALRTALWLPLVCVLFTPVLESLTSGQKGTLLLLLFSGVYLLLVKNKPLTAGMLFGLLAFKPQLVLVLGVAMLAKRQWRFTAGAVLTAAMLGVVSLALGGEMARQYVAFTTGAADYAQTAGYDLYKSHCLYGFFTLLFGGTNLAARGATILASLGVLVLLVRTLRGSLEPGGPQFARQFATLVLATVLLSPHLFTYDLTVLLLPLWLLASQFLGMPKEQRRLRAGLALALAALFVLPGISPALAATTGIQLTVPLMLFVLWKVSSSVKLTQPSEGTFGLPALG